MQEKTFMNKRVFVAVNIPQEIRKEIVGIFSSKLPKDKMKVVEEENLHITLKFLGYFSPEAIEKLKENLLKTTQKKFSVELKGIGHFNGRVLWVGVGKGSSELEKLSRELDELLELKNDSFHSHVTLARNNSLGRKQVSELAEELNRASIIIVALNYCFNIRSGVYIVCEHPIKHFFPHVNFAADFLFGSHCFVGQLFHYMAWNVCLNNLVN